jgi:septum formation protein
VAADTVIALENEILEKPSDAEAAKQMLRRLSGRNHRVLTAVSFAVWEEKRVVYHQSFCERTDVVFEELSDEVIQSYIEQGECYDKAGSYAVQGFGSSFVSSLRGCYYNVVGFPVHRFCRELLSFVCKEQ